MSDDWFCYYCDQEVYRAQNYPMDGGFHWRHTADREISCNTVATPARVADHTERKQG